MIVDFEAIPAQQEQIHARLRNWARWCRGRPTSNAAPIFRLYRSTDIHEGHNTTVPVDGLDAARIAKGIGGLPESHRHGLQWYYVHPVAPTRAAKTLGLTLAGLAELVIDGRTMLINRRA